MDHRLTLSVASLLVLAGCGGSGGAENCFFGSCNTGGGGAGGGASINLDETNVLPALREGWYAATTAADIPAFTVGTGVGDMSGGTAGLPGSTSKLAFRNVISSVPYGPTTFNCVVSGTFVAEGDVTDINNVTAGDNLTYTNTDCDNGTGYSLNGVMNARIESITGDPNSGNFEQGQTLDFTDFIAVGPGGTTTLNGSHLAIIDTTVPTLATVSFSGNAITIVEDQISAAITAFTGFSSVQVGTPGQYELDGRGNVNSSLLQGSIDYNVEERFVQPIGQNPNDGIFDVFGGDGSIGRFAIVDQNIVRVQLDQNASGNFEISVDITWPDFIGGNPLPLSWQETGFD